jgi:hypothetical protein
MIWDDKAKSADLPVKERNAKRAMHIVCEKGRAREAALFVRAWLKSPQYRAFSNFPMKFVPNYAKGQGMVYNTKFGHAVRKHMKLTAFGIRSSNSSDFDDLDARCEPMTGKPTLRQLILAMRTRPTPAPTDGSPPKATTPVFLSIDPATRHSDRGSFVATYTIDNAVEAEEKLRNLLSYLIHEHGDSATYWFNPVALERADNMAWDDENERPITIEEMDLDDLLEDDLDWVANLDAADITFRSRVEVTLTRPSLLQNVSNNPLRGETDSVQTFHRGSPLPTNMAGDNSDHRDAEMSANSIAGDSQGSLADAV